MCGLSSIWIGLGGDFSLSHTLRSMIGVVVPAVAMGVSIVSRPVGAEPTFESHDPEGGAARGVLEEAPLIVEALGTGRFWRSWRRTRGSRAG